MAFRRHEAQMELRASKKCGSGVNKYKKQKKSRHDAQKQRLRCFGSIAVQKINIRRPRPLRHTVSQHQSEQSDSGAQEKMLVLSPALPNHMWFEGSK